MSIHNLIHKIKDNINIDKTTFMFLFIIVGVGIGSFALGRLSIRETKDNFYTKSDTTITEKEIALSNQNANLNEIPLTQSIQSGEKRYVASKNGKMYYSLGCSGAKRIKEENKVWFSSAEDAEKSGYAKASSCK